MHWKTMVSECIEEKISKLQSRKICPRKKHTSMKNKGVKETLKDLHNTYIIIPIEKGKFVKDFIHSLCLENLE